MANAAETTSDIATGARVRVEITRNPTNDAARKTLVRVLAKDPQIAKKKRRDKQARARSMSVKQRGGRPWEHRPTMVQPVETKVGTAATLKATADVLRDLKSLSRFVKITNA